MEDRRTKRSADRAEALQYLVEAVADRNDVRAIALVDDAGRLVAGVGMPRDLMGLKHLARPIARREPCIDMGNVTRDTDVTSRALVAGGSPLYLAALGDRIRGVGAAVRSVERILAA
jgi:hypothetical protein